MVHTILNGGLFDVGVHIRREIEKLALSQLGRSRGGLWFPFLISQLCRKIIVPMGSDEMICEPKVVLDCSQIMRITTANLPDQCQANF